MNSHYYDLCKKNKTAFRFTLFKHRYVCNMLLLC